ncbi:hypothetical protein [Brevundimonas sp. G8]|uniref:hypothetical protein n=1 Tax=Brevundimonas sp. G8 TaxID=1350776 RepID=UPI0012F46340|nr:hypothetical protein [Brevundimonas sp. G8]VXC07981.1 conserved hypothetical protein [Brevundimonas sp. G8]
MLTLLMLALSDPAAMTPSTAMIDHGAVRIVAVANQGAEPCGAPLIQAQQGSGDRAMTLDRSLDDGQARRYLLLDRRDRNNCPLPISYAIPDQPRALGREFGPTVSVTPPRPSRPGQ